MPIAHECKCGLVTPLPESQGGKRVRCKGCGTIAVVVIPEPLEPDPTPVPAGAAGPEDTAPPPPPRAYRYKRQLTDEQRRADYPRTGGVIDWRKVCEDDDDEFRRRPPPPDPQTRYLNPQVGVTGRLISMAVGAVLIAGALTWAAAAVVLFGDVTIFPVLPFLVGCGILVRGFFGRRYLS